MPNVTQTMNMGIMRYADTEQSATKENACIQKARRTLYSLMSSGLHGENGLDPESHADVCITSPDIRKGSSFTKTQIH